MFLISSMPESFGGSADESCGVGRDASETAAQLSQSGDRSVPSLLSWRLPRRATFRSTSGVSGGARRSRSRQVPGCPQPPAVPPVSPLLSFLPSLPCSVPESQAESGACFDVGFDRFVCCCIHLLCIRELTGRKMKICLRFSA